VAAVDAVTSFITASGASSQAFKTATLLKTLNINALIIGESGVGKKSLAKYILQDASVMEASNHDELLIALDSSKEIIITNLEKSPNISKLLDTIEAKNLRLIATASPTFDIQRVEEFFALIFSIPPLSQREEDIKPLIEKFTKEASELFESEDSLDFSDIVPDLSKNGDSLKRQIMVQYLLDNIKDVELMQIIEKYLFKRLGSNSDYKDFLYLYEAPLINAGLKKFKSQLQLSDKLGLNRNTLRKKIAENKQYL
jgi:DNA-binding NtrC family response regulator